jgi:hypothetical protein
MKDEAERNAAAIDALERERSAGAARLADLLAFNARTSAEVGEIESKSLTAAGNARASAEVLAAEQRYAPSLNSTCPPGTLTARSAVLTRRESMQSSRGLGSERRMLDAEAEAVTAELAQSEVAMEEMEAKSIAECKTIAAELPGLRNAFRKRCRDGYSNAVRLSLTLDVLECEQLVEPKRPGSIDIDLA